MRLKKTKKKQQVTMRKRAKQNKTGHKKKVLGEKKSKLLHKILRENDIKMGMNR